MLDVNEIAAFEEKLIEREKVLKKAQAVSRLGYWKFIPSTGEVVGSEELFRIFGLVKDETDADAFFSLIHPDDVELVDTALQRCAEKGERLDVNFRVLRRDDSQIWIRGVAEAITNEKKEIICVVGTSQDITDIVVTNKALRESELWMKSIFNSLDEAVLVVSPERELINVNKAAEAIFGYTYEEISNNSTELFHVDHQHYVEFGERIKKAFSEGKVAKFEFKAKRKNGEIFPTEHTVSQLRDASGEIKGIVSVVKDITERKLAEESLLKNETRLNEAQRIAKVGAWELDLVSNELVWSDEVYRIFEIDKETFPASYEAFLDVIHPDDRDMVEKAYSDSLVRNEQYEIVHRLLMCDGRVKYVHEKCESIFDSDGKAIRSVGTVHDLTEWKLVEDELEKNKARFGAMFESMPDAIVYAGTDRRIQLVNNAAKKMYGYDESELYGNRTIMLYASPDDFERMGIEHFNPDANHDEASLPYVVDYKCKDGRVFQGETIGFPVKSSSGEIMGYMAAVRDTTDRRKTEEELTRVQGMLKKGNSIARMGAWSIDLLSNELEWSDITKEIHEVEADFKPDIDTAINFYKEGVNRDAISRIVRDAMEDGGSWDEELVIVTAKGNEKWVRAMGQPEFKDGVCVRLYGSFQDITERKQAEEDFKRIFELSPDMVGTGNLQGYFTRINSSFSRILGYSEEEFMARPFIEFVYEDDVEGTLEALSNALGGERDLKVFNRYVCKDGSIKWIEWDVLAVADENTFYATGRDVTERKETEVELQKYRHELEEAVIERTQELRQSLAEKEVLLKEVHHRVKNNMAMISAFIRLQMPGIEEGAAIDALQACENRIQAMSMVHKRLYQSDDFTSIKMHVLLNEICSALYEKADYKNIDMDVQVNDVSLEMDYAIPSAMIVNELVTNTLKHAFRDGQSGKISILMSKEGDGSYRLRVSDNGRGIPSTIDMDNATTLGLQLVNVFVGQLNGKAEISRDGGFSVDIRFSVERASNS